MSNWTGVDFFIFLIFLTNTILGMSRGATKEIISIMCLSAALIITIKFTIPLTMFITSSPLSQDVLAAPMMQNAMRAIGAKSLTAGMLLELSYCISMLICFVGTFSVCEAMLSYGGLAESYSFPYATLNRKVGATLGATRGYIFSLIFISVLQHLLMNDPIRNSYFINLFQYPSQQLNNIIIQQNPDKYNELYRSKDLYKATDVINTVYPPQS